MEFFIYVGILANSETIQKIGITDDEGIGLKTKMKEMKQHFLEYLLSANVRLTPLRQIGTAVWMMAV